MIGRGGGHLQWGQGELPIGFLPQAKQQWSEETPGLDRTGLEPTLQATAFAPWPQAFLTAAHQVIPPKATDPKDIWLDSGKQLAHTQQGAQKVVEWQSLMPAAAGTHTAVPPTLQAHAPLHQMHQHQALWGSAMPFGMAPLDAGGLAGQFAEMYVAQDAQASQRSVQPGDYDQDSKIVAALCDYLRGKDWVEITTPRQINEACAAIVRCSGVSLQKLNKKLKKGSWRDKLTNFVLLYPSMFALNVTDNTFFVKLRVDAPMICPEAPPISKTVQTLVVGGGTGQSAEDQVVDLVRALLLHLRSADGREWVDITNMPKAAHMIQQKKPVVGVSLRWGSRHVGPEEWQRLMSEIRMKHGKLANFLSKYPEIFEIRSRPGGKDIRLTPETARSEAHTEESASRAGREGDEGIRPWGCASPTWSLGEKLCDNCGRPGHLSSQCTSSVQCHCCGSSDHTKKDCPRRGDKCTICGKVGHLAAKCREAATAQESTTCFVLLETRLTAPTWPSDWHAWVRGAGGGARVRGVYSSGEAAALAAKKLNAQYLGSWEGWEVCGEVDNVGDLGVRSWALRMRPAVVDGEHTCLVLTVQPSTLDAAAP